MPSIAFAENDTAEVQEFEHPNGELGILIGLRLTQGDLIEYFDLDLNLAGEIDEDQSIVMPLKHKADGATNFESYSYEGERLVVTFTDEQYTEVRTRLTEMLQIQ